MNRSQVQRKNVFCKVVALGLAVALLLPVACLQEAKADTAQPTALQTSSETLGVASVLNGFVERKGKKYYYENGKKIKGQRKIGKYWYMFHPKTGVMITGWYRHTKKTNASGVKVVYYDKKGRMRFGRNRIQKKTYTFSYKTGALVDRSGKKMVSKKLKTNLANAQKNLPRLRKSKAANGTIVWWMRIPKHFRPRLVLPKKGVLGKESVSAVAKRTKSPVVINAGIHVATGEPYGITAVGKEIKYIRENPADTMLLMDQSGKLLSKDINDQMYREGNYAFSVKGFHPVIQNGARTPYTFPGRHPRTFIGQMKNGNYFVGVTGGRGVNGIGLTYDELCTFVTTKISKNTTFLYNLDGGGSSCMAYKKEVVNKPTDGAERKVANCLAFY